MRASEKKRNRNRGIHEGNKGRIIIIGSADVQSRLEKHSFAGRLSQ